MLSGFNNVFERKPAQKHGARPGETSMAPAVHKALRDRGQTFSKVFRWRLPAGQTQAPATVEIAGSFTHWQKMPLTRGNALDGWQATLHHIPGNRTHHYMLLADGKPVPDENADGMAIPHGPQEEQFQLMTPRGGRVFMLYSQTK